MTSTALVPAAQVPATSLSKPALLRPIVRPAEVIEAHKEAADVIRQALEDGRDYGNIPGAGPRKVLLKAGAERLMVAFGLRPSFSILESEHDHDREVSYVDRFKKQATSRGLYRYVVRCQLERDGVVVGEGIGSCSTMEQKYVSRPRDCENTVLKMAKKRAQVDAVLSTLSLSDRFTQDVDDVADDEDHGRAPERIADAPAAAPRAPAGVPAEVLDLAAAIVADGVTSDTLAWAVQQVGVVTEPGSKLAFALGSLISQRSAQLADESWAGTDKEQAAAKYLRGELEKRAAR